MFYIGFVTGPRVDEEGWRHAEAEITLGDFRERLVVDLRFWDMPAYEAQWRRAVVRVVGGAASGALVTSYGGPGAVYHLTWPMWRDGGTVHVQERTMFVDQLAGPFDPEAPEGHVGERTTKSKDGEAISEWDVPLGQLATFALDE